MHKDGVKQKRSAKTNLRIGIYIFKVFFLLLFNEDIMLQESSKFVDNPYANQIRIAFARGNNQLKKNSTNEEIGGSRLYGGIFQKPNLINFEDIRSQTNPTHWGDEFHNYVLLWTPTKISLAVDGKTYGEIDKSLDVEVCFCSI